jgi:hypothetical protein
MVREDMVWEGMFGKGTTSVVPKNAGPVEQALRPAAEIGQNRGL